MVDPTESARSANLEAITLGATTWVHVERPTQNALQELSQRFGLPQALLDDCLTRRQQARLIVDGSLTYLSLRTPVHNKLARIVTSAGVSCFVGPSYVATVNVGDARAVSRLFRDAQADDALRSGLLSFGPSYLLYAIADRLVDHCLQTAEAVTAEVEAAADGLLSDEEVDLSRELLLTRRQTSALGSIAREATRLLARLAASYASLPAGPADLTTAWSDLQDRLAELGDRLSTSVEAVDGLASAGQALRQRQIGQATRVLAIAACATLPAILLLSLFSLNVRDLPLAGYPYAFEVLLAATTLSVLLALYLFRWKRWL
jgi:magnesium transporter